MYGVPSMSTSPLYGSAPVESRICTSRNRIFDFSCVPKMLYSVGCRLGAKCTASMVSMLRGGPEYLESTRSIVVDHGFGDSTRAGAIVEVSVISPGGALIDGDELIEHRLPFQARVILPTWPSSCPTVSTLYTAWYAFVATIAPHLTIYTSLSSVWPDFHNPANLILCLAFVSHI
jgi:hypothetical protein